MKVFFRVLAAITLILSLAGCNPSPAPVHPIAGSSLVLNVPSPSAAGLAPKFTLILTFKYRIVSGSEVVEGSLDPSQIQSVNGPFNISLPHDGTWLVSAEWFNSGVPILIGADQVNVQGSTNFTLQMGELTASCYQVSIDQLGSTMALPDLFTFDTHVSSPSTIVFNTGDIQCKLSSGPVTSIYFTSYTAPLATFAYLGNGDWVDFTLVPSAAVFYADTLAAKRASLGSSAVMEVNDVYAVKISASTTAWIQVGQVTDTLPASYAALFFRTNRHGFPYLKFDVTAYGDVNCNTSGVTLY